MNDNLTVTIGWDGYPTIRYEGGKVFPRRAEDIFNADYYPEKIEGEWPKDPKTNKPLPAFVPVAIQETQRQKSPLEVLLSALSMLFGGGVKNAKDT